MPQQLTVHAVQQGPMEFAISDGEHDVTIDYALPGHEGPTAGMTPLRLILASLAGCSGSSIGALLRRDGTEFSRIEVTATGSRRDEHPTVITDIALEFTVYGDVDPAKVEHALDISEKHFCPVWAMLKPGTPITATFSVVPEQPAVAAGEANAG